MLQLLTDHWKLELPNLLISVAGGTKDFQNVMNPRLKEAFMKGIMKAAEATG